MTLSIKAATINAEITEQSKLGDLRTIAKKINKDHALAMELWSTGKLMLRLFAILIMDPKELEAENLEVLFQDIQQHDINERIQLADWLMANQLGKNKKTIALMESWEEHPLAIQRRLFWYHQGRLRWVGQKSPNNTSELLTSIEKKLLKEKAEVQWAMNFTAAWIGIYDKSYRSQCIKMGEKLGLYKDEIVAKNCHPNYLPKFIQSEVEKRKLL